MASCNVPDTLNRHEPSGNIIGKKTLNPRFALTWGQLAIVVAVGAAGVLVAVTVAVPLVFAAGVVVGDGCAVFVASGVPEGVTVGVAPSSRKSINSFPHQCSFDSATLAGLALDDGGCVTPDHPEHEANKIPDAASKPSIANHL